MTLQLYAPRNRSSGGGPSSLAHELAAAFSLEPTTGSRLFAEEFGIEYDEGAEGIDGSPPEDVNGVHTFVVSSDPNPSMDPPGVASGSITSTATEDNDEDIPDATTGTRNYTLTPRTRYQRHAPEQARCCGSPLTEARIDRNIYCASMLNKIWIDRRSLWSSSVGST